MGPYQPARSTPRRKSQEIRELRDRDEAGIRQSLSRGVPEQGAKRERQNAEVYVGQTTIPLELKRYLSAPGHLPPVTAGGNHNPVDSSNSKAKKHRIPKWPLGRRICRRSRIVSIAHPRATRRRHVRASAGALRADPRLHDGRGVNEGTGQGLCQLRVLSTQRQSP